MISGVGELDIEKDAPKKVDAQAKDMPYPDCPFLLLDVRDRDAYDQCHIIGGEEARISQQPSVGWGRILSFLCRLLAGFIFFPPRWDITWVQNALGTHPVHPSFLERDEGTELMLIPYSVGLLNSNQSVSVGFQLV